MTLPDVVLHVPCKSVSWVSVHKPDNRQILPCMQLELVEPLVLIVDVVLIIEEGNWPQLWWDTLPEFLRSVIKAWIRSKCILQYRT